MGLLDYYRRYEDIDQEEVNRGLRERRAREKALALERVPLLDLSSTEWPDFPSSEVVNASIAAARGRVNGYPDRHATELRRMLAERHGLIPEQVVVGNGAAELMQSAAHVLLSAGDELVTPWPSYPLYPLMAARAGGRAVPVGQAGGRFDPEAILAAVGDRTRVVVICNPNDPTGGHLPSRSIHELASELPERVRLLVDEAFVQFQTAEEEDAVLRLVHRHPSVLVFRTFSKIYGLSGLRTGYAVGSPDAAELLAALAPALGVNVLSQAAAVQALKIGDAEVARRRGMVTEQRARLHEALHDLPLDAPRSEANFLWLSAAGLSGAELAARLERQSVLVAPGGPLGADDHVRVAIRGPAAGERLLTALGRALAGG